jgi:signal transduction histidine kinase
MNRLHARDAMARLEAVARGHMVDIVRDACLEDPKWFLAGPRLPRPRLDQRNMPDADVHLPRPSSEELPFEMFAYDDQYSPSSVAGPRFPEDFRRAMRAQPPPETLTGTYTSRNGTGYQTAIATKWGGACSYLLFRQQPVTRPALQNALVFLVVYGLLVGVATLVARPVAARMRKLAFAARQSARSEYSDMVPVTGSDEIGSMAAQFNDTAADIRRRVTDARDREELLRRYVENSTVEVAEPLSRLEADLDRAARADRNPVILAALRETHRVASAVRNNAAVVRLRSVTDSSPRSDVNLAAAAANVIASREALARAAGVTLDASGARTPVTIQADESLISQAIANIVDNAILYNREGGWVRIALQAYDHGKRFRLTVTDNGRGVSDEEFAGLTANRRFRGDESRTRRPGERGLGLALAREIADRFGLQLDIRRPMDGGLEVEVATRV